MVHKVGHRRKLLFNRTRGRPAIIPPPTTTNTTMSGRPVVVLAGWLGCQRPFLRRYEELYHRLGFEVLSYIATPRIVVGSTYQCPPIALPKNNSEWPAAATNTSHLLQQQPSLSDPSSLHDLADMQQLAWHVLGDVHRKQPHTFLFHGFSNGGCFLWEQITRILLLGDENMKNIQNQQQQQQQQQGFPKEQPIVADALSFLRQRLNGVVFDSSPAWFIPCRLRMALQHCSWKEKIDILIRYGPGTMLYDGQKEQESSNQRCQDFFRMLYENSLDISELYLYSEDDPLSSFEHIDKLVHHRKSMERQSPVFNKTWKESQHCTHLRIYPQDYTQQIEMFTTACLRRSKL